MANKLPDDTYDIPASMPRGENRKRCPNGFRWDKKKELCIGKTTINVVENLEDIKIKSDKNTMSLESLDENNGIFKFYSKGVLIEQKRIDSIMIQKIKLKKKNMFKKIISISKKINKNPNIINNDRELQKQILKISKKYKKNKTRKSGGKNSEKPEGKNSEKPEDTEIVGTDLIIQESMSDKLEDKELNEHILKITKLVEMNEYNKNVKSQEWLPYVFEVMNLTYLFLIMPYEWYSTWSAQAFSIAPCDESNQTIAWNQSGINGPSNDDLDLTLPIYENGQWVLSGNDKLLEMEMLSEIISTSNTAAEAPIFQACSDGNVFNCLTALQPLWGFLSQHLICQNTTTGASEPFTLSEVSTGLSTTATSFFMFDIFGSITLGIVSLLNIFIDNEALKTTTTVSQYIYYLTSIVGFTFFGVGTWFNIILIGVRLIMKAAPTLAVWAKEKRITAYDKEIENEKTKIEEIVNKTQHAPAKKVVDIDSVEIGEVMTDAILSF
jgi:hypothetical protein